MVVDSCKRSWKNKTLSKERSYSPKCFLILLNWWPVKQKYAKGFPLSHLLFFYIYRPLWKLLVSKDVRALYRYSKNYACWTSIKINSRYLIEYARYTSSAKNDWTHQFGWTGKESSFFFLIYMTISSLNLIIMYRSKKLLEHYHLLWLCWSRISMEIMLFRNVCIDLQARISNLFMTLLVKIAWK